MPRTPIHPGEHLAEELRELGITAAELSRQIDVPVNRITGIIHGQRGITADTALRLAHWFGTTPQFWMNLQQLYELRLAENEVGAEIAALPRRRGPVGIAQTRKKPHEPPHQGRESAPGERPRDARPYRGRELSVQAHRPAASRRFREARPEKRSLLRRRRQKRSPRRRSCPQRSRPWW